VARGIFSSWEEALREMVHVRDEFLPREEDHQIYEEIYEKIFSKIFGKLSPLYQEINGIINRPDVWQTRPGEGGGKNPL
jgi:sugar (pentulose or hexulose) kinase